MGVIKALGFGILITGIVLALQGLMQFIKDPSWENFGKIIQGIGIAIIGLGVIIGLAAGGWVLAIIGAVILIVGTIVKYWNKIKTWLETAKSKIDEWSENIVRFLLDKMDWVQKNFGLLGTAILTAIMFWVILVKEIIGGFITHIKSVFEKIYGGAKEILEGIIMIFKGDFKGGIEKVGEGIKKFFSGVWENIWYTFTWFWSAIIRAFQNGGKIFDGFKEGIVDIIKNLINGLITGINWAIAQPLNRLNGALNTIKSIEILGQRPFDGLWEWNPIPVPQIPHLKVGGIINMPNRGTLVGGGMALGGEAGREGVVPLTDKQAMAELGREIGKNVLVNLTNITQMNGRVISRELKQVRSTQEFAYNM